MLLNCGVGEDSWTARRWNQLIRKEISPEYSLEGLMLKLKLQYFGHLTRRPDSLEKILTLGNIEGRREEKGTTEDEMFGWHHWLNRHEFEQAPGVGDGQESLVCCSPWGRRESDTTKWLNWAATLFIFVSWPHCTGHSVYYRLHEHFWMSWLWKP